VVLTRLRSVPVHAALTSSAAAVEPPSGSALVGRDTALSLAPPAEVPKEINPPGTGHGKPEIVGSEVLAASSVGAQKISAVKNTGNRSYSRQVAKVRSAAVSASTQPRPVEAPVAAPAAGAPPVPRVVRDPANHQ